MGKGKYSRGNKVYRATPVMNKRTLPHDDAIVLQHEPLPPLERGGVYTEMGADFTYEELNANQGSRLSNFDEKRHAVRFTGWYVGMLALIVSIVALFAWPFWTGLSGLILSSFAYKQGTKAIAVVSIVLSIVAMLSSMIAYFAQL